MVTLVMMMVVLVKRRGVGGGARPVSADSPCPLSGPSIRAGVEAGEH